MTTVKKSAAAKKAPAVKKTPAATPAPVKTEPAPAAAPAAEVKKPTREEVRAQRYPSQAKKDAEKAAAKTERKTRAPGEAKPAKPVKEVVKFIARHLKPGATVHALSQDARPTSGARLFAHTHAALTVLGMLGEDRPAVSKSTVLSMMGQRAVVYHEKQGNFESAPNHGLRLSISGRNSFMNRLGENKVDGKLANAFVDLFIDNKVDPVLSVAPANVYTFKPAA